MYYLYVTPQYYYIARTCYYIYSIMRPIVVKLLPKYKTDKEVILIESKTLAFGKRSESETQHSQSNEHENWETINNDDHDFILIT